MKIKVLGWFGHSNVGDESYKITFPKMFPGCECAFMEEVTDSDADLLILGGGGVCSKSFLNQARKFNGRKIAMSVSLTRDDPINELTMFDAIFVRDFSSLQLLSEKNIKATYAPDLAFLMEPDVEKGRELINKYCKHEKKVVVVFNGYLRGGQQWLNRDRTAFEYATCSMSSIMDATDAGFVFLPFCTKPPADDRVTNAWLASCGKFYQKYTAIYEPISPQDSLNIISAADAVISSRLHSSIFSCVAGKPFIDLTHHDKNKNFLETIYKQEWSVSYWHFDYYKFAALLNQFLLGEIDDVELLSMRDANRSVLTGIRL